jgi:16S rRNA (adenine1518-N6/adenine1519-N6)-dimethyltransferase
MNKKELMQILENLNMHPGKRFGQNFMIDENLTECIVKESGAASDTVVVEIGPGLGALTSIMVKTGAEIFAVEIDKRLQEYLRGKLGCFKNFHLIEGDACRVDIESVLRDAFKTDSVVDWKCVANLPYSISSPFIARILTLMHPPYEMLFLLQKETAQRLAADKNSRNYGALSARVQNMYDVKIVRKVPPDVFFPVPEVDSALVKFVIKSDCPDSKEMKHLSKVIKAAFLQRRKKMIKALSSLFGKEHTLQVFEELNISTNARAQELSTDEFRVLAEKLAV